MLHTDRASSCIANASLQNCTLTLTLVSVIFIMLSVVYFGNSSAAVHS